MHFGQDMTKVTYGCVHQNLASVAAAKYYLLRAFPERMKRLSSILTNIWRFEATYVIRFGTSRSKPDYICCFKPPNIYSRRT